MAEEQKADLVGRLRYPFVEVVLVNGEFTRLQEPQALMAEAADEIERLRPFEISEEKIRAAENEHANLCGRIERLEASISRVLDEGVGSSAWGDAYNALHGMLEDK